MIVPLTYTAPCPACGTDATWRSTPTAARIPDVSHHALIGTVADVDHCPTCEPPPAA